MLLITQNDTSEFWDFSGLSYGQIENIYQGIKLDTAPIMVVSILIALIIAIVNLINQAIKHADMKTDGLPIGAILDLFKEKWKFFLILALMPVMFSAVEAVFGFISDYYNDTLGEPEANFYDKINEQVLLIQEKEGKETGWFHYSVGDIIDYILTMAIQPFIVLIDQWTYSIAIMYKFFFQGILELLSSVAVAFLLNDRTQQKFFAWFKAVIVCYMLIPVFLLANWFVDAIRDIVVVNAVHGDWIFQIVVMFTAVKILLFASGKMILWRVL